MVTRVSECFIKPSHDISPDPDDAYRQRPIHLTPFELVSLNANYSQKGLLYPKPPSPDFSITAFLNDLRRSLSATLTSFHPLAGRLATIKQTNPPSYVIYLDPAADNSPGIKFVYATADVTISDVLTPTDEIPLVHSFFDLNNAINHDGHTLPLLSVQVTELVDGIFIGGSINHVVADGTSYWRFMTAWSQTFRSSTNAAVSLFIRTGSDSIKGCDPVINLPYTHHDQFIERLQLSPNLKERFFHFSSSSISKLKAKANAECNMENISSLQAVSALLWRCISRARRRPLDTEMVCKLATSNRHRLNPPLPDDYFGNPVILLRGTARMGDLMSHGLGWAALRLYEAVKKHDDRAVRQWVESWSKSRKIMKMSEVFDPNSITIGSSPRFDMYGCEFGLGKPVATRSGCSNKADGKITLFPGGEGGGSMGVEVCLLPEYMMNMECDDEFVNALN